MVHLPSSNILLRDMAPRLRSIRKPYRTQAASSHSVLTTANLGPSKATAILLPLHNLRITTTAHPLSSNSTEATSKYAHISISHDYISGRYLTRI